MNSSFASVLIFGQILYRTKGEMGAKGNKAAVAKLRTIGEILKDADRSRAIPEMLRKKLISAGLTDLQRGPEWINVPTPPLEELTIEDNQTEEPCEATGAEEFAIEPTATSISEESRETSPERVQEEEDAVLSEAEGNEEASASEEEAAGGWGLLWCMEGKEMHVVEYFGEESPWRDMVDNEGDVIMAMRCRECGGGQGGARRSLFVDAGEIDEQDQQAFRRMRPWMFEKMGPREVAEAERGKPVAIAQRGEGVAFVDVEKIFKRLGRQGARIRSVNMERYEMGGAARFVGKLASWGADLKLE